MDHKKLNLYLGLGLLLSSAAMIIFTVSLIRPGSLGAYILHTQFIHQAQISAEQIRESVEASYDISFAFPAREPSNAALFIPVYEYMEQGEAMIFLENFDIGGLVSMCEDGDGMFHIFKGTRGELHVNKYYNRVIAIFHDIPQIDESARVLDNDIAAAQAAENHVRATNLPFDYAQTSVTAANGGFYVSFYREVGGLISKDHAVRVALDDFGNLLSLDYYRLRYERIASVGIISMKDAFYRLPPLDYENGARADLKKATLVYRFTDSIMQPAYLFEGEINKGGGVHPFLYFVNASDFS